MRAAVESTKVLISQVRASSICNLIFDSHSGPENGVYTVLEHQEGMGIKQQACVCGYVQVPAVPATKAAR
jgi:hypothetical protein